MRKLSQTMRIALALFLTVFSANIVPAAAAYAKTDGTITTGGSQGATGTLQPVWCQLTGNHWSVQQGTGDNAQRFALMGEFDKQYGVVTTANISQYPTATLGQTLWDDSAGIQNKLTIGCEEQGTITPSVTVTDQCGTANDSVIPVVTTGIDYSAISQNGLTYTVTATADKGHVLALNTTQAGWTLNENGTEIFTATLTDTPCQIAITPVVPTIHDTCGTDSDSITLPENGNGITYTQSTKNGNTIVVTATPDAGYEITVGTSGYVLQSDGTATYTVTFTQNDPCLTEVTPTTPTSDDACGTAKDTYTIPEKTGVIYQINGQTVAAGTYSANGATSVTITTVAAPNYALTGTTQWSLTFSATPCATACILPSSQTYIQPWSFAGTTYPEAGASPSGTPGTYEFANDQSFVGLHLNTPANESYVDGLIDAGNRPLSAITTMSYKTYRDPSSTGNTQILPAYVLEIDKDGNPLTTSDTAYLLYEPIYNGTVQTGVWQTWDAYNGGNAVWWGAGDSTPDHTWSQLVAEFPDATVLAYGFNQGTYNAGANTYVQHLVFDCATTNFSAPGKGGFEPGTPPSTPAPASASTPAPKAPAALPELPHTGPSELNLLPIGFLVASLLYGAVYFAQPKKWYQNDAE